MCTIFKELYIFIAALTLRRHGGCVTFSFASVVIMILLSSLHTHSLVCTHVNSKEKECCKKQEKKGIIMPHNVTGCLLPASSLATAFTGNLNVTKHN